jgi:predicted GIY-YIG superfamily endonuclease/uncharacterized Zn ribbon protein
VKNRSHNSETNYLHGNKHNHKYNDSGKSMPSFYIYVLQLEEGKYYVGKTIRSVHQRFKEHKAGNGAAWTSRYVPIRRIHAFQTDDDDAENKEVRRQMEQFGIDNVRGGSYSQVELSAKQMERVKRDIRHDANKQCLHCGRPNPSQRNRPQQKQHYNDDKAFLDCDGNELQVGDRVLVVSKAKWTGKTCRIVDLRDDGGCMIHVECDKRKEQQRRYLAKSLQLVL